MIVYDVNEEGVKKEMGSFHVTRDGWYEADRNVGGIAELENRSVDPLPGKDISEKVDMNYKKSNYYGKNDVVFTLPELWSQNYPAEFLETGDPEHDRKSSPDGTQAVAKGVQIHVGGYYEKVRGGIALSGTYGCFGIVDPSQIYKTREEAQKALSTARDLLSGKIINLPSGLTTSNNVTQEFNKKVESARESKGKMKDKMKVVIKDRSINYSKEKKQVKR
jgi:hypothetical protein